MSDLSWKEISDRLAGQAEQVARYLIPTGRKIGGNWRAGSVDGGEGDSLGIQISGSKAGIWADFAGGGEEERGDLLDLWRAVRKCSRIQAFKEAKEWLGVRDPVTVNKQKVYHRPDKKLVQSRLVKPVPNQLTPVEQYLTTERKLSLATIDAFLIRARPAKPFQDKCQRPPNSWDMVFPSLDLNKELLNVKYIGLDRKPDGKKFIEDEVTPHGSCPPALFGWQAFDPESSFCLITEGQIDAMTWYEWGVRYALSMPSGASNTSWIDYEWENLAHFDRIYLCFDMDEPGRKAAFNVSKSLGVHRCFVISLPEKDANECLKKGHGGELAARLLMEAKPFSPTEIKSPDEFREEVYRLADPQNEEAQGARTLLLGDRMKFRKGETTLWTGHSHHGKSTALNQIMIELALSGRRIAICSMEMKGPRTVYKLSKCISAQGDPTRSEIDQSIDWLCGKFWIYDIFGQVTEEKLFELMNYSVRRHGVTDYLIDSLMKSDISSDDYEGQRKYLNRLIQFGHDHDVHIHVVGHPRKHTTGPEGIPDMHDVHGGQSVTGQPDNVIAVYRHKSKEDKRAKNNLPDGYENELPDSTIVVRKQRATGLTPSVNCWYIPKAERFTSTKNEDNTPYYPDYGIIQKPTELEQAAEM